VTESARASNCSLPNIEEDLEKVFITTFLDSFDYEISDLTLFKISARDALHA